MDSYVPFVNTEDDCSLLRELYSDAGIVRVSLRDFSGIRKHIHQEAGLWIDPSADALHHGPDRMVSSWLDYLRQFEMESEPSVSAAGYLKAPERPATVGFARNMLEACAEMNPAWLSVPQVPVGEGTERNQMNRYLADAAGEWRASRSFEGKMVLPVIFFDQDALNGKTQRNGKVRAAVSSFRRSMPDIIWVVNAGLNDETGYSPNQTERLPGLVAFHQELANAIEEEVHPETPPSFVAGPYWGMNIVLWARGLAAYPAVTLGKSYRYHVPGGIVRRPSDRVAIPALRRRAVRAPELRQWLVDAAESLEEEASTYLEASETRKWLRTNATSLKSLADKVDDLVDYDARYQIAFFYRRWLESVAEVPPMARGFRLYEDLSKVFALAQNLPDLPKSAGIPRHPGTLAQHYMLNCL